MTSPAKGARGPGPRAAPRRAQCARRPRCAAAVRLGGVASADTAPPRPSSSRAPRGRGRGRHEGERSRARPSVAGSQEPVPLGAATNSETRREGTHVPQVDVEHGADVGRQVRDDDGAQPEVAEKPGEDGPEWQAPDHGLDGDRPSGRGGLRGDTWSAWASDPAEGASSGPLAPPTGRRGALYLLSQRGHDVLLFPDTYARVTHGVIVNHREPQDTAAAAHAAWKPGPTGRQVDSRAGREPRPPPQAAHLPQDTQPLAFIPPRGPKSSPFFLSIFRQASF